MRLGVFSVTIRKWTLTFDNDNKFIMVEDDDNSERIRIHLHHNSPRIFTGILRPGNKLFSSALTPE